MFESSTSEDDRTGDSDPYNEKLVKKLETELKECKNTIRLFKLVKNQQDEKIKEKNEIINKQDEEIRYLRKELGLYQQDSTPIPYDVESCGICGEELKESDNFIYNNDPVCHICDDYVKRVKKLNEFDAEVNKLIKVEGTSPEWLKACLELFQNQLKDVDELPIEIINSIAIYKGSLYKETLQKLQSMIRK